MSASKKQQMITVYGEHRGLPAEVPYNQDVAVRLRDRTARIVKKACRAGNKRMAATFQAELETWNAVIDNPALLNLVEEFGDIRRIYLDHVLYDHDGFLRDVA